jgi:hypothetical protein
MQKLRRNRKNKGTEKFKKDKHPEKAVDAANDVIRDM